MADDIIYRDGLSEAGDDPLAYVLSDESVDSYGDIISSEGWVLSEFRQNPIALYNHNRDLIIGRWEGVSIDQQRRLTGRLKMVAPGTSPETDYVRALVEQKMLRGVSVGFIPLEHEPLGNDKLGRRFLRSKLKEASLVSIPANSNALVIAKSLGLGPEDIARLHPASSQGMERRVFGVSHGKLAKPTPPKGTTMTKLAKRIQDAQAEINRLRDSLVVLSDKDERTDEESVMFEELPGRIEHAKKELANLEAAERALAGRDTEERSQHQTAERQLPAVQRPFTVPHKKMEPRDYLVRLAVMQFVAKATRQPLEKVLADRYNNDEATGMVLRAAVNPATTTTAGWAAELLQTAVSDLITSLMPVSIYPRLAALGTTHTFSRNAGAIRVPARTATPSISGAWVGEGAPIPVRRLGLTSVTLTPKKLAVISTFTSEIAQYSTPAIEGVIREEMARDTAITIDSTIIDDVAGSAIRPAGLRNGVAGLVPSALADLTAAMVADLKALIEALTAVNGGQRVAILMNVSQAMGIAFAQTTGAGFLFSGTAEAGTRFNADFIASTTVPDNMVIAVDAAEFTSAIGTPEYNVSEQATVHEEDTTPLAIGTAGAPPTVAAPVRSLWQTDTIGVRMIWPCDFAMRRTGMVAWMSPVIW